MLHKWLLDLAMEPSFEFASKETPWDRILIAGGFLVVIVVLLMVFYINNKDKNE